MGARCKALCKKTRFHYGFVTNFARWPGRTFVGPAPKVCKRQVSLEAGPMLHFNEQDVFTLVSPLANLHRQRTLSTLGSIASNCSNAVWHFGRETHLPANNGSE